MPKSSKNIRQQPDKSAISGIVAGVSFVLIFVVFRFPILISAIVATALFFTVNALLGSKAGAQISDINMPSSAKNTSLMLAKNKLSEIEQTAMAIHQLEVRQKVRQICSIGYNILDEIKLRPNAIKTSRQFLNYYIDATGTIVTKYAELQSKTELIPSAQASLDKVEKTLNTVESAFKKQLEKLYDKDVMDLDIELTVLAKTIKSEGL